jgi:hypothetical protein
MRTRKVVGLAVSVAVLLVGAAVALSAGSPAGSPQGSIDNPRAQSVGAGLTDHFAVLRRTQSAGDALPATAVAHGRSVFGANPALARRARPAADGSDIFVAPGTQGICLAGRATGTLCAPSGQALAGEAFGWSVCGTTPPGKVALYGLVPDGASNLAVTLRDGSAVSQEAQGNVLYALFDTAAASGLPNAVVWDTADGSHKAAVLVADDVVSAQCSP